MTATAPCYACGREPATWSDEHIIPNALGGRWKSRQLLCQPCNSSMGHRIDSALCDELRVPMNLLGLTRNSGKVRNESVQLPSGDEYLRDVDGNLRPQRAIVREYESDGQITISLQAANARQARDALEQLAQKYPGKIDVESWLQTRVLQRQVYVGQTAFRAPSAGSEDMFRAVAKIAVSAFLEWGGARAEVQDCVHYIHGLTAAKKHCRWFYTADVMAERGPLEVAHIVAIRGAPATSLWAYVELFRVYRFAVRLSEHYSGPAIQRDYVYDLIERKKVSSRSLELNFEQLDVAEGGLDVDAVREHWSVLIRVAERRTLERSIDTAVREAITAAQAENPNAVTMGEDVLPHLDRALLPLLTALVERLPRAKKDSDE